MVVDALGSSPSLNFCIEAGQFTNAYQVIRHIFDCTVHTNPLHVKGYENQVQGDGEMFLIVCAKCTKILLAYIDGLMHT